jgi:hypothetical protein
VASSGSGPKLKRTTTSISEAAETLGAVNVRGWPMAAATPFEMIRLAAAVSKSDSERTSCDEAWQLFAVAEGVQPAWPGAHRCTQAAPRR